ncbi:TIGR03435 family protein [Terriglobus roseus]|uniref:Soil-associated protein, TIGR03435 family n=1 Tax=Terriglobus roseus TaxID=392734 RepID=A0A1H4TAY3_9BACT|nr:TIGR03435 family protein [Terriglobus roseus]SEC53683.1 soil-associated protein, TIGR03435 family [Terriglobus roseus]
MSLVEPDFPRDADVSSLLRFTPSLCILAAASACAQTAPAPAAPSFETASVRPSKPGAAQHTNVPLDSGNIYGTIDADDARSAAGGLLIASHQPLWRFISFAYKLSGTQELALRFNFFSGTPKSGAPFWVTGSFDAAPEFFDVTARAPADTSIDQMRRMMQTLLAERFHLVTHTTTADAPVFALVLVSPGVLGPDLLPSSDKCEARGPDGTPAAGAAHGAVVNIPGACGVIAHVASTEPGQHYGGHAVSLSLLATSLPTMTGMAAMPRPVVDQTGLNGLYDFTLSWVHDASGQNDAVGDNSANILDALKKQLGLRLKPAKAPISFLVVEHVERPSEN